MKMNVFTEDDVMVELKKLVNVYGSGKTARRLQVPQCSVINAVKGRKGVGGQLAAALGYRAVYVRAKGAQS